MQLNFEELHQSKATDLEKSKRVSQADPSRPILTSWSIDRGVYAIQQDLLPCLLQHKKYNFGNFFKSL